LTVTFRELTMRQLRVGFLVALCVAGLAHGVIVRAQATTTIERFLEPFDDALENPCTGEPVVLSGELKITTRITVDNQGKTHLAYNLVPSQVRGEGADGTQYKAVGGQREHYNSVDNEPPITDTFTETFNLISAGGGDNFLARTLFHISITADGTVRVEIERLSDECRG
jgi:hypothetical protein